MRRHALVALFVCACTSTPAGRASGPGTAAAPAAATPGLAGLVEASEAASRPVDAHRQLSRLAGDWTVVSASIDAQGRLGGETYDGTAELGMILGGRYLLWRETQNLPGGPRESVGFVAYDKVAREWQWSMATDLSTGIGVARGEGDLRSGVRFVLEVVDGKDGTVLRARSRLTVLGDDEILLERLGAAADGTETTVRRVLYKRRAPVKAG